jgi:Na+-translocating ferredoxin:NAD+ oxidoreductase RnfD subunit
LSIAVAKHAYGGLGQNLFHPAMLGLSICVFLTPQISGAIFLVEHRLSAIVFFLLLVPGFFLLLKKWIHDQTPIAFLLTSVVLFGNGLMLIKYAPSLAITLPAFHEYFACILFIGFFVLSDPTTSGMLPRVRSFLGIIAAVLVFIAYLMTQKTASFAYALVISHFLVPWLEQFHSRKLST